MKVRELIEELQKLDGDILVAVNGVIPVGVEVVWGYSGESYNGPWFKKHNIGTEKALVFQKWVELSNGEWERTPI